MTLEVRDARVADGPAMGAVQIAAWRSAYEGVMTEDYLAGLDPTVFGDRWARSVAELEVPPRDERAVPRPLALLVAAIDGEVVAMGAVGPFRARTTDEEPTGELWMLNADPRAFGTGAALAVHHEGLRRLAAAGHREAVLWVVRENPRARRFYEREGWTPDGLETVADLGGVDVTELRYRRVL